MKRILLALLAGLLLITVAAPAQAGGTTKQRVPVYDNPGGTAGNEVGWTQLHRDDDRLRATVHTSGLTPGGAYTFWLITINPPTDPLKDADVSVHLLDSKVVGQNGRATAHGSVDAGTPTISGIPGADTAFVDFVPMSNPEGALVRIEIAYHGQAAEAGDELDAWLSDFWTGEQPLCSSFPGPGPDIRHCPIEQASHIPA